MAWHSKLNSLSQIPALTYEGYYWASDSDVPVKATSVPTGYEINGQPANPFILEAHFYCDTENISISVRHVSGRYLISQYNLSELAEDNLVEKSYLAHRSLGGSLRFKDIWLAEPDPLCENMAVLTKKATVFKGFENKEGN